MKSGIIKQYDFARSYEKDWDAFLSSFPGGDQLKEGTVTFRIRECCCAIDKLIRRLYRSDPGYGTQMDIYFAWKGLKGLIEDHPKRQTTIALNWFVRQLMNMIVCNNPAIKESIWYAMGVDYFECGTDGAFLFLPMYEGLPDADIPQLVRYSSSIQWESKVITYHQMMKNREHHTILANALQDSCGAYCYGSANAAEALKILNRLDIGRELYHQVWDTLTTPFPATVRHVAQSESTSPDGVTGFLSILADNPRTPTWFPFAELWIENRYVGTFEAEHCHGGWKYLKTHHPIILPETEMSQEKILRVKIPFDNQWAGKSAHVKPAGIAGIKKR